MHVCPGRELLRAVPLELAPDSVSAENPYGELVARMFNEALRSAPHRSGGGAMLCFMFMRSRTRITRGGQISIPAAVRHRWGTSTVSLDDQGDRLVIEPAPDDPLAAAEGAHAAELAGIDTSALRRRAREDARAAERRRRR